MYSVLHNKKIALGNIVSGKYIRAMPVKANTAAGLMFIFGLMFWSYVNNNSVIRFLLIRSSSFSRMYPSLKKEPKAFHCLQSVFRLEAFVLAGFVDQVQTTE